MTLADSLKGDLKRAIFAKDDERLRTLRLLIAAIKNKEIEERKKEIGLSDEEIIGVIQKEAKKRRDAIEEFTKAGRSELVHTEEQELAILEAYLPQELSDEEVIRIVREGIREVRAAGPKDFGMVMKVVMPVLKARAGGDRISRLAREELEKI